MIDFMVDVIWFDDNDNDDDLIQTSSIAKYSDNLMEKISFIN